MVVLDKDKWFVLHLRKGDRKWHNPTEVKKKGGSVLLTPHNSDEHPPVEIYNFHGTPHAAWGNEIDELIDLPEFIAEMIGCKRWWDEKIQPNLLA